MENKFNGEIFANNLYKLRKSTMSQKKLAEKLGVQINTVRRWEQGKNMPSQDHLVNIAEVFNVSVKELTYWELESKEDSINIPLENRDKYDAYQVNLEIGDTEGTGGIILPFVTPNGSTTNESFKMAYEINKEIDASGNSENIMNMIHLYDDALYDGLIEVATNILRVLVRVLMVGKIENPNEKLPLQDKLNYYIKALEMINHPAGGYYRAFSLIYKAMETDKSEDENFSDGLILMDELACEGNGLAELYLDYIDCASSEEEEAQTIDNQRIVPLINPENVDYCLEFRQAYDLNILMENTGDDSSLVEMITLYEKAFNNGDTEAGINILNVITGVMINVKKAKPENELIFDDILVKYIEELEERRHPAGEFFRSYALANSIINNGKPEEENLDDGMIMMYTIAHNGNKFAKDFINMIESTAY